jgi:hypothetical protein
MSFIILVNSKGYEKRIEITNERLSSLPHLSSLLSQKVKVLDENVAYDVLYGTITGYDLDYISEYIATSIQMKIPIDMSRIIPYLTTGEVEPCRALLNSYDLAPSGFVYLYSTYEIYSLSLCNGESYSIYECKTNSYNQYEFDIKNVKLSENKASLAVYEVDTKGRDILSVYILNNTFEASIIRHKKLIDSEIISVDDKGNENFLFSLSPNGKRIIYTSSQISITVKELFLSTTSENSKSEQYSCTHLQWSSSSNDRFCVSDDLSISIYDYPFNLVHRIDRRVNSVPFISLSNQLCIYRTLGDCLEIYDLKEKTMRAISIIIYANKCCFIPDIEAVVCNSSSISGISIHHLNKESHNIKEVKELPNIKEMKESGKLGKLGELRKIGELGQIEEFINIQSSNISYNENYFISFSSMNLEFTLISKRTNRVIIKYKFEKTGFYLV